MNITELKERINARLEVSDKKILEAVYALLESQKPDLLYLTEDEAQEIDNDIDEHLSKKRTGLTFEEVVLHARKQV